MSGWTTDMAAALPDSNNTPPPAKVTAPAGALPSMTPQEHGWGPKVEYRYEAYNKSSKDHQATLFTDGDEATEDIGVGGIARGDWASNAQVYEWDQDYGDVGPEHPELEKQLFGGENHVRSGVSFENIASIDVVQEGSIRLQPIRKFEDAGLHPVMLQNVKLAGYDKPTPIQQYCLPAIAKGYDIVACAQTGSGKTAAFLVPILSKLMGKAKKLAAPRPNPAAFKPGEGVRAEPLVLIVCPNRELATQIFDESRRFCYRTMLRPCVIYGGGPISAQAFQLERGCDLLIGTPGRLIDFIKRPHLLTLKRLRYVILDEADEMLRSDWENELKDILTAGDQEDGNINYMMFSATFPKVCRDLAKQHLAHDHVRIRVGRAGSSHMNIQQEVVFTKPEMKRKALVELLLSSPPARTIIFVNSKRTADEIDDFLFNNNFPCTSIHSDRTQLEREDSIRAFRSGKMPILIATGVSSRGLDIHSVMHVVNYDLPSTQYGGIEEYTHRIGRTGRIGNKGVATSFYNERDVEISVALVKTLLETHQKIPDFLEEYIPEGFTADGRGDADKLQFDADSNDDAEKAGSDTAGGAPIVGSGWDNPAPVSQTQVSPAGDSWGGATW